MLLRRPVMSVCLFPAFWEPTRLICEFNTAKFQCLSLSFNPKKSGVGAPKRREPGMCMKTQPVSEFLMPGKWCGGLPVPLKTQALQLSTVAYVEKKIDIVK